MSPERDMSQPIVVVDTDAVIDMTPWGPLAKSRDWDEFFSHISEASPCAGDLVDLLELAKSDGCWVTYSSRWDHRFREDIRTWLVTHDAPRGSIYMRTNRWTDPATLVRHHVSVIARKAKWSRPVFVIHANDAVVSEVRMAGISVATPQTLPSTVSGFRDVLARACHVPPPTHARKDS